ncbi:MAG: type I-E CRISPR-associated protein Cas7/Cse4/CasC, partial [Chloroflexi bacterium]|nr:type I-E CRISPR-associated protein Cas7/Cse4/CasC [Chloroflexota bacterium]
MTKDRIYVDIHALQTIPPSCVNRDDTGSPKTAIYGGVRRARVSSQSWKKAIRDDFAGRLPKEELGIRTKRIVSVVAEELAKNPDIEDPESAAVKLLEAAQLKIKSPEKGTDALFFISRAQVAALADLAKERPEVLLDNPDKESKNLAKEALTQSPSIDIALFGRMVANDPSLNTDACAQVAHAISTHAIVNEFDYFTAVDDLSPEDSAGAAHIGTVEFNAPTLYRYATVALHELKKYLVEDTTNALLLFLEAFVRSMPTGKQNTFANRTLPSALLVTVRYDQPVNLVGAFEKPVPGTDKGYV